MDPLTTASAFASIVGLICNFRSERQSKDKVNYSEFLLWLENRNYIGLKSEIDSNHLLGRGIKSLLSDNHDEIMAKLKALESSMSAVSSHIGGFKEISEALAPNNGLSDQAFSIIKQLYDSGGSFFLELHLMASTFYQVMDASGKISINEPRFVDDDLTQLCNLGFLRPDYNGKGDRLFHFTRAAEKLIQVSEL